MVRKSQAKRKAKRPLALNVITLYVVASVVLSVFVQPNTSTALLGFLLALLAIYYGLLKMRRDGMWLLLFLFGLNTLFSVLYLVYLPFLYWPLALGSIVQVVINATIMYWIYTHMGMFKETAPQKR